INALDDYADGTTTTAPSIITYHTAGFDELSALNVQVINTALVNNALVTLADMQTSISALNTLTTYALDNTSTAPSTADYTNAGVTSVGSNILDYLNSHLGKEKREGFTHYLKASNAHANDQFGYDTAISDDGATLAVLARAAPSTSSTTEDAGAVYVYRRNGDRWTEVAILRSEQTSNHAYDMAMTPDGQRIVMLAPNVAYIFDVPVVNSQPDWDGTWSLANYSHGESDSSLYIALSTDGKTLVTSDGVYSSSSGRIRIHQEVDGTWTYRQQHAGSSGTGFGEHAVAMNGDGSVIAVGAYNESSGRGYVDIYRQATETTWTRTRNNLGASNGASSDNFGWSVSLNRTGDRLAVGARYEDGATNNINGQGAVYLFDYDGSAWNEIQILRASDAAVSDYFGEFVSLTATGDKLAVSTANANSVYTYDLSNADSSTWQSTELIFNSPSVRNDEFGTWGLAFNGTEVVVGAYTDDTGYLGVVTNSDSNTLFDENDASSTGTAFDNTDTSITNSGAVYVMTNAPYALAGLEYVQARADGSNTILAWAAGGATPPTAEEYAAANVTDVDASNLSDVNTQLQILAHTDMADVQPMVTVINKILDYTTDTTNPIPTNGDYALAGISGVNADNYDTLNGYVGGQSVAVAGIPALVTQVDHLLVLRDYSADSNNTEPVLANFTGAGVSTSRAVNLADYNTELVNQTLTTEAQFQALVDAINALDDYADGTTTTAPTITTYHTAGFDELPPLNVQVINTALVNNTLLTLADMQTSISALNTLTSYALDDTSTAPSVNDYTSAGLTSVGSNILSYLNSHLDKEKRDGLTHYLKASDAHASDFFGFATAISDNGLTLAVLAQDAPSTSTITDDAGAVYVYRRNGDTWTEMAILRSDQASNHAYDMAMTPDGQRIVMLAPNLAYIFDVPLVASQPDWDGTWSRTNYSHGETETSLFIALSADGKTMVTGDGNYSSQSGRIRIHQEVDGTWTYRQQHNGSSGSYFAERAVAVSGDGSVIAVGAYNESSGRGYVDIFRQATESTWSRTSNNLSASNWATSDLFGWSVSLNRAGDRLAVGARYEDGASNNINSQGAVYVFDYDGSSWNETQILRATDAASGDDFGEWVELTADGNKLAVSTNDAEAVYTYDLSNADSATWQSTEIIFSSPSTRTDEFGTYGLAFNGYEVVVGAYYDDYTYQGVLTNIDANTLFDGSDYSATGVAFDSSDTSRSNSGAVYVMTNAPYALAGFEHLQARIDGSNTILAWAAGGSSAPSEEGYFAAEVINVTSDNLSDVNTQLQILGHTDMLDIQPMVDAINTIRAYSVDANSVAPTNDEYALAGVDGVNADNYETLNGYVGGQSVAVADIPALVTQVDHLLVLRDYSADSSNTEPVLANFTGAGVSTARTVNLSDYNSELVNQTLSTEVEFQALVDAINALDDYADGTTTTAPTITTYHTAGFDELNRINLEVANTALVSNTFNNLADIQVSISAITGLVNYALDDTSTT
ncbi:hypothetical protein UB34_20355, partial [Photobacterium leiognathi]|uniref:FG-GAP repeat protein n=1 Tax=Photobacterium leiognathi TaxID=553611 RepID=UPI0005D3D53B